MPSDNKDVQEVKKYTNDAYRRRLAQIAERTDKKLVITSLLQALVILVLFQLVSILFGESIFKSGFGAALLGLIALYVFVAGVWLLTSVVERNIARRKLKELK